MSSVRAGQEGLAAARSASLPAKSNRGIVADPSRAMRTSRKRLLPFTPSALCSLGKIVPQAVV
jgi:hypothetical protein